MTAQGVLGRIIRLPRCWRVFQLNQISLSYGQVLLSVRCGSSWEVVHCEVTQIPCNTGSLIALMIEIRSRFQIDTSHESGIPRTEPVGYNIRRTSASV